MKILNDNTSVDNMSDFVRQPLFSWNSATMKKKLMNVRRRERETRRMMITLGDLRQQKGDEDFGDGSDKNNGNHSNQQGATTTRRSDSRSFTRHCQRCPTTVSTTNATSSTFGYFKWQFGELRKYWEGWNATIVVKLTRIYYAYTGLPFMLWRLPPMPMVPTIQTPTPTLFEWMQMYRLH